MKESNIEARLDKLKAYGFIHLKFKVPGRSHLPDRLIMWPTTHPYPPMFLELKLDDEPRPAQIATMADMSARGCHVLPVCGNLVEIDGLVGALICVIKSGLPYLAIPGVRVFNV